MKRINDAIKTHGVNPWFDEERMSGDIRQKMVDGIENSDVIVVFITEAYRDKVNQDNGRDNCRFEFKYAFERKGPELIIPVVMEPGMRNVQEWKGTLLAYLPSHLYIDFSSAFTDNAIFDAKVKELVSSIDLLLASSSLSHGAIIRSPPPSPVTADLANAQLRRSSLADSTNQPTRSPPPQPVTGGASIADSTNQPTRSPPPQPVTAGASIRWDELEFLEVIGKGAYSVVLKAKYGRHIVAVKVLNTPCMDIEELRKRAVDEFDIIRNAFDTVLRKHSVVQAIGICEGKLPSLLSTRFNMFNIPSGFDVYGIVLRYEGGGSLESVLYGSLARSKIILPLQEKIRILMQIASGLDELHTAGILHGDIKPANVLLSDNNPPLVRLSDFGHSEKKAMTSNIVSTLHQTMTRKGSPIYNAPECIPSSQSPTVSKISRLTDVYSFAILAWEVLNKTGKRPYADITSEIALYHHVAVNDRRLSLDELVDDVPPTVLDMIRRCWDKDRTIRFTALECYNILDQAYNTLSQAKFDIYLSHSWRNKNVLRYVKKFLNSYGYRVWYDQNEMSWDLSRSMRDGIENSQIVLVCLNKLYLSRENCMFELIESRKINKNIVTLVTESDPFALALNNTTYGNAMDLCQLSSKMFFDIGELCAKPGWPAEDDNITPVPDELLDELKKKVSELIKSIQGAPLHCRPSMPAI